MLSTLVLKASEPNMWIKNALFLWKTVCVHSNGWSELNKEMGQLTRKNLQRTLWTKSPKHIFKKRVWLTLDTFLKSVPNSLSEYNIIITIETSCILYSSKVVTFQTALWRSNDQPRISSQEIQSVVLTKAYVQEHTHTPTHTTDPLFSQAHSYH